MGPDSDGGNRHQYIRSIGSTLEGGKCREEKKARKGEKGNQARGRIGRGGTPEKGHLSRDLKTMQR